MTGFQPFYAAFLRKSNERGNVAFILWISQQWRTFEAAYPSPHPRTLRLKEFEVWLTEPAPQQ